MPRSVQDAEGRTSICMDREVKVKVKAEVELPVDQGFPAVDSPSPDSADPTAVTALALYRALSPLPSWGQGAPLDREPGD